MALLKPEFIRAHPIQAGMLWAVGFASLGSLMMWLMGWPLHWSLRLLVLLVLAGLVWGYSVKFIHDLKARRP
jgi:hypothetical protein